MHNYGLNKDLNEIEEKKLYPKKISFLQSLVVIFLRRSTENPNNRKMFRFTRTSFLPSVAGSKNCFLQSRRVNICLVSKFPVVFREVSRSEKFFQSKLIKRSMKEVTFFLFSFCTDVKNRGSFGGRRGRFVKNFITFPVTKAEGKIMSNL